MADQVDNDSGGFRRDPTRNPVLNTPFEQTKRHWQLGTDNRAMNKVLAGRRASIGLLPVPASPGTVSDQQELEVDPSQLNHTVMDVRKAVDEWRLSGYKGATRVSKRLLWHWRSENNQPRLFFAQVEALETLIWLTEVAGPKHRLRKQVEDASRLHNGGARKSGLSGGLGEGSSNSDSASRRLGGDGSGEGALAGGESAGGESAAVNSVGRGSPERGSSDGESAGVGSAGRGSSGGVTAGGALMGGSGGSSSSSSEGLVRYAVKMATGTGKTTVMGMVIAWHAANAAASHRRAITRRGRSPRYHTSFLAITPGHTVRERLAVLKPSHPDNIYDEMPIIPQDLRPTLGRVKVRIVNFQAFQRRDWLGAATGDTRRVLRRGSKELQPERPAAMLARVLRGLYTPNPSQGRGQKICVLNDEAHHCYLPQKGKRTGADKNDDKQAALWFNALAALNDEKRLGPVYDFSATPMFINTAARKKSVMFPWVVSDFPLMDAIEAGLVKIPRVPVKDDTRYAELQWRNLYQVTKPKKILRNSVPPTLASALDALYRHYESTFKAWQQRGMPTPPVFIVVANTIPNADALYQHLSGWSDTDAADSDAADSGTVANPNGEAIHRPGARDLFSNYVIDHATQMPRPGPLRTLLVHSKLEGDDNIGSTSKLGKAMRAQADQLRAANPAISKKSDKEVIREALNTVGRKGELGEQIRCVVSVSMLTEGWDTRTVTHILGFRAFSTQLLCEQVTGRALRRSNYDSFDKDGRLTPEFADVLGVPYDFMPADGDDSPSAPRERYRVHTMPGRHDRRIEFPALTGYVMEPQGPGVRLDSEKVNRFSVGPRGVTESQLGGVVGPIKTIRTVPGSRRRQQVEMELAAEVTSRLQQRLAEEPDPPGASAGTSNPWRLPRRLHLFRHSVKAVREWIDHPDVVWKEAGDLGWLLSDSGLKHRAVSQIVEACLPDPLYEGARVIGCFDNPTLRNTDDIDFETSLTDRYPSAISNTTTRSELNVAACHSDLERRTAELLDIQPEVRAWVRNFRLDWSVPYEYDGVWRHYVPDFVARLFGDRRNPNAVHLMVECKGVPGEMSERKHGFVRDWWIPAVRNSPQIPPWLSNWSFVELRDSGQLGDDLGEQLGVAITKARTLLPDRINANAA